MELYSFGDTCATAPSTAFAAVKRVQRHNGERSPSKATKSLASTQDEERAIVELEAFYNVSNVWDETITVERAGPKELATPIWNPKKIQRS